MKAVAKALRGKGDAASAVADAEKAMTEATAALAGVKVFTPATGWGNGGPWRK